jgi:uncharacterized membrane protein YuzA (DUF378 family)
MKLNTVDRVAMVLVIIGGLNWGLVGSFQFNLVAKILGDMTLPARIVYFLVGVSAVYLAYTATKLMGAAKTKI